MKTKGSVPAGSKRLQAYFAEITESHDFNEEIAVLRKKHKIPVGGYAWKTGETFHPIPPTAWKPDVKKFASVIEDLSKLCEKYDLFLADWYSVLLKILFLKKRKDRQGVPANYFLMISDHVSEKEWKRPQKAVEYENTLFPISLRISPYASKRDLLDYITKNYRGEIEPLQAKYADKDAKIGKYKNKDLKVKERNAFILKHRDMPYMEIMRLVNDRYGKEGKYPDVGTIGKIISLDRKKRKEV